MQSVTYFSSLVFSCPPRASHNWLKQFLGLHFHKIFPQLWYFNTILVRKSKKMSIGNLLNQIRFWKNLLCNICWLYLSQLIIGESDMILRQTVNRKNDIAPSEKDCSHCGQTLSAFWLMKGLLKLFYLMHPGHNWGHHLL
jgi:hypothetical protein